MRVVVINVPVVAAGVRQTSSPGPDCRTRGGYRRVRGMSPPETTNTPGAIGGGLWTRTEDGDELRSRPASVPTPIERSEENDMTATYTFDVFSSLDGYGAANANWSGYWGKQGP